MKHLSLSRALSTLLWAGAFICSFYILNRYELGFFVASVTLLFAWAWVALGTASKEGWHIPKSPVLLCAGLFWILTFASIFWSELPLVSLSAFCFFSALPLTFFVFTIGPDERQFRHIAMVMALVFTALGVWAIIQYLTAYNPFGGQAHHPLADPNALGGFFNIALVPAIGALMLVKSRVQMALLFGFIAIVMGGLIATGSRGAFFSLIPALAVMVIFAFPFAKQVKARLGGLVLILAALLALAEVTTSFDWNSTAVRLGDTVTLAQPDVTNNRLNIWDGAINVVKHHWLIGTGFGTFFLYYPEFRSPAEHIGVSHAHSDPLQYWAELGILGPILFYAFLIAALVRTWKALARVPSNDVRRIHILAPLCALGAVVIQTHVSFNFYNLCILFGCGFLLAVWFDATRKVLDDKTLVVTFPADMGMAMRRAYLVLPFLGILFLFGSYMASEHFVNRARDALMRDEDLFQFAANLQMAHELDHGLNFRTWLLAANIPLGILKETENTTSEAQKQEFYDQAQGQLARVRLLNPRSASAAYYQGLVQSLVPETMVKDGTPPPETFYKEALRLDPLHLGARMALASLYEERGDEDAAVAILKEGFDYTYAVPQAMDFYGRLMILALARGDKETHQEAMNRMVRFKQRMETSYADDVKKRGGSLPMARDGVLN